MDEYALILAKADILTETNTISHLTKMVFMYTINALIHEWWEKVTVIVWGDPLTKLLKSDATLLTI